MTYPPPQTPLGSLQRFPIPPSVAVFKGQLLRGGKREGKRKGRNGKKEGEKGWEGREEAEGRGKEVVFPDLVNPTSTSEPQLSKTWLRHC